MEYRQRMATQAMHMALLGKTNDEIMASLGVDRATFERWRLLYPEFSQAIREGRDVADGNVAASLYHRAIGYSHPEVKVHFDKDGIVSEHQVIKHYPPDTKAAETWLKTRQPQVWDRPDVLEHHVGFDAFMNEFEGGQVIDGETVGRLPSRLPRDSDD